ncbi:hypothetical protein [Pararhizobium sp.]|uniref:hypothetical protein n=1 Tax=Pararhizobium sp. TaxID=1977563 RepID=UPI00271F4A6D|nr:hypothetical protein [Pararhizobium sp.]MDO9415769.1 hypothetical protein [Pararhizobium sp.]
MTREQFLRELRHLARARSLDLKIIVNRGKGSHYRITLGDRATTLKSGELTPAYVQLVRKQLGI